MLTRKAILNALAAFIDQAARILVGFIVTPLLVRYLGVVDFGVWQILQKMSIQLSAFDGRAAETLKWTVANDQSKNDEEKKRRIVGAAVTLFILFLPLLILINAIWWWMAPEYIGVEQSSVSLVRYCVLILSANLILIAIFSILEAILRGVNKGYKRIGVLALILILGGALNVLAVSSGYGLVGISCVQIIVSLLTFLTYYRVVRRHVSWAGIAKPKVKEVTGMFSKAKWFVFWAFINIGIYAGDVILLGFFSGSEVVSQYVLTFYAANMITVAILTAVSSVLPGLGGLVGAGQLERASSLRIESLLISWILSSTICAILFALNKSFIYLWVGEHAYIGDMANLLIIFSAFQLVFIRHDAFMLNMMLDIKRKVLYGAISLALTILLAFLLVPKFGVIGLSGSLILGRSLLSIIYPRLIRQFLTGKAEHGINLRKITVTLLVFVLCFYSGSYLALDSWWSLFIAGCFLGLLAFSLFIIVGANKDDKAILIRRMTAIKFSIVNK